MTGTEARALWSAADLLAAEFPEPRWAVPGIIPEGLTLLAGPPKVGKSWLSLGLAVSITTGGRALYLALEDTPRRLRSRLETVLTTSDAPAGLAFAVDWPAMPDGGAAKLHDVLAKWPDIRLVVVDVLAKVRGGVDTRGSMYDADYAAMGHLKNVADAHSVAVVVVHHVRKSGSDDFLETVSGTNGLAGASDTIAVLRRSRNTADAVLHITGRDVEEAEHALKFDPSCGAWSLLDGPAADYDLSDTRRAVAQYLREAARPLRPAEIAEGLGLRPDHVRQICSRMTKADQLTSQDGRYAVTHLSRPLSHLGTVDDQGEHPERDRCDRGDTSLPPPLFDREAA